MSTVDVMKVKLVAPNCLFVNKEFRITFLKEVESYLSIFIEKTLKGIERRWSNFLVTNVIKQLF